MPEGDVIGSARYGNQGGGTAPCGKATPERLLASAGQHPGQRYSATVRSLPENPGANRTGSGRLASANAASRNSVAHPSVCPTRGARGWAGRLSYLDDVFWFGQSPEQRVHLQFA